VSMWSPKPRFFRMFSATRLAKWAGYIDQYLLFPMKIRSAARNSPQDTLFVFCDQSMGPWMPLVKSRPHVVHAHDLLALRSALGDFKENPTSLSGRIYQRYIRRGFRQARHFISISAKTRDDLHRFGLVDPITSEVVYNGLNFPFEPMARDEAQRVLEAAGFPASAGGILLHVGGSQWYKNLAGVISIYARYTSQVADPLPLWCISPKPGSSLDPAIAKVAANGRVLFFQEASSEALQAAYSIARAFLFPSFAEGFGWPLIEAQACGCPVITTNEPPMNEVAGDAALYLPRLQYGEDVDAWAARGAQVLQQLLAEPDDERLRRSQRGRTWAKQFDADRSIDAYLKIYERILRTSSATAVPGVATGPGF